MCPVPSQRRPLVSLQFLLYQCLPCDYGNSRPCLDYTAQKFSLSMKFTLPVLSSTAGCSTFVFSSLFSCSLVHKVHFSTDIVCSWSSRTGITHISPSSGTGWRLITLGSCSRLTRHIKSITQGREKEVKLKEGVERWSSGATATTNSSTSRAHCASLSLLRILSSLCSPSGRPC